MAQEIPEDSATREHYEHVFSDIINSFRAIMVHFNSDGSYSPRQYAYAKEAVDAAKALRDYSQVIAQDKECSGVEELGKWLIKHRGNFVLQPLVINVLSQILSRVSQSLGEQLSLDPQIIANSRALDCHEGIPDNQAAAHMLTYYSKTVPQTSLNVDFMVNLLNRLPLSLEELYCCYTELNKHT